ADLPGADDLRPSAGAAPASLSRSPAVSGRWPGWPLVSSGPNTRQGERLRTGRVEGWEARPAPRPLRVRVPRMRLYALVEAGDPEASDVFLRPEDAQRALQDCGMSLIGAAASCGSDY